MRPDQNDHGRSSSSFDDDPLLRALADLDPAATDSAPVVGSDRHLTILEHAMSNPTDNAEGGGARITPLPFGSDQNPDATDLDAQAAYPTAPGSNGRRRGPGRLAVGVAAILATFAGGFAFNTLTQPDGASTPEAAVEGLFDAVDDEDLIGVIEALEPAERRILRPALEHLSDELERTGVTSGDLDLGGVDGLDLTVDGLDLRATYLDDDVATVKVVSGTIQSSGNVEDLPVGRVVRDLIESDAQFDTTLDSGEPADLSGTWLVARRVDGSWHVSLQYTAAEMIRQSMDPQPDPPSFGRGIAPTGADSPEAAVRDLVDAAIGVDIRRMVELMPPGEGDVFHDYGPILVEQFADTEPADIDIEALDLVVTERSGDAATVGTTRLKATSDSGGDTFSVDYDGECTITTWSYRWTSSWEGDEPVEEGTETSTHNSCDDEDLGGTLMMLAFDLDGVTVNTVEHDGRWYVSPATTIFDWLFHSVAQYDADQLERDIAAANSPWVSYSDEFWTACGIDRPAEDVDLDHGYQAIEDCWAALPEDYSGTYNLGGGGPFSLFGAYTLGTMRVDSGESFGIVGEAIGGPFPGEECYGLHQGTPESRDEALSCLEGLVAEGSIDPQEVQSFRCNEVYDDLYSESRGSETTEADFAEADRAWEACMNEAQPPIDVMPMPDGSDSGTTATTMVANPVPAEVEQTPPPSGN